jgi:hypothetical protein
LLDKKYKKLRISDEEIDKKTRTYLKKNKIDKQTIDRVVKESLDANRIYTDANGTTITIVQSDVFNSSPMDNYKTCFKYSVKESFMPYYDLVYKKYLKQTEIENMNKQLKNKKDMGNNL